MRGYERKLRKCRECNTNLHRSAAEGLHLRKKNALLGPQRWFLGKKKETKKLKSKSSVRQRNSMPKTVTVFFVPQTKKGELAKRLQKVEDDTAKVTCSRVRVERAGTTIRRILHRSNPWAGGNCSREKCLPCFNSDGKTDCFTKNVVYSVECITCEEGKSTVTCYIGETSRSLHCRGVEHWDGFQGKKGNSPHV